MICPKCEEGAIEKIQIKTGEICSVCTFCHSLWISEENIRFDTGHLLDFFREKKEYGHAVRNAGEKDREHRTICLDYR